MWEDKEMFFFFLKHFSEIIRWKNQLKIKDSQFIVQFYMRFMTDIHWKMAHGYSLLLLNSHRGGSGIVSKMNQDVKKQSWSRCQALLSVNVLIPILIHERVASAIYQGNCHIKLQIGAKITRCKGDSPVPLVRWSFKVQGEFKRRGGNRRGSSVRRRLVFRRKYLHKNMISKGGNCLLAYGYSYLISFSISLYFPYTIMRAYPYLRH